MMPMTIAHSSFWREPERARRTAKTAGELERFLGDAAAKAPVSIKTQITVSSPKPGRLEVKGAAGDEHPPAIERSAECWAIRIDAAALSAHGMRAPRPGRFF
jgi:hypothetical protein